MLFKITTIFRNIFLLALTITLTLAGCSKKGDGGPDSGDYYFKFTVGSQSYNYTANSYATFSTADDIYLAGIGGFEDMSVGTKNVASVLVGSLNTITQSTYAGLVYPGSDGNTPKVFFSWIDGNGKTYSSLYQDNATNTLTITRLSSSSVSGTFSGKIYDISASGSAAITYSGEFYVKRVN